MMKKVKDLMAKQLEERKETGVSIVNNTFEALKLLGQENLLEQKVIEVEKIVKVEIPVEINNKELEEMRISNEELNGIIKGLKKELASERRKATNSNKRVDKLTQQVTELKSEVKKLKSDKNKELIEENKHLKDIITKLENKLSIKTNAEFKVPTNKKEDKKEHIQVNDNLKIFQETNTTILGQYKDVIFEASKRMDAITIYNPKKYNMKGEIETALKSAGLFTQARDVKDKDRIENEIGSCHEVSDNKYIGFVMDNGQAICYVYEPTKYDKAISVLVNKRINNANVKYDVASNTQQTLINQLVAQHEAVNNKRMEQMSQDAYAGLGLEFLDETNTKEEVIKSSPSVSLNFTSNSQNSVSSTDNPGEDMMAEFAKMLNDINV